MKFWKVLSKLRRRKQQCEYPNNESSLNNEMLQSEIELLKSKNELLEKKIEKQIGFSTQKKIENNHS